jgi:hypothetical protein
MESNIIKIILKKLTNASIEKKLTHNPALWTLTPSILHNSRRPRGHLNCWALNHQWLNRLNHPVHAGEDEGWQKPVSPDHHQVFPELEPKFVNLGLQVSFIIILSSLISLIAVKIKYLMGLFLFYLLYFGIQFGKWETKVMFNQMYNP